MARPCSLALGVLAAATAPLLAGCTSGRTRAADPAVVERAQIVAAVRDEWEYESSRPEPLDQYFHGVPRHPPYRPAVLKVRILRGNPGYAGAVVALRGAHGRTRDTPRVLLLRRGAGWPEPWGVIAGPAVDFPRACTLATPRQVRALVCPNPWTVLGYARPRSAEQTSLAQRVASSDLHRIDWRKVVLPGAVCGSSRPVRPRRGYGGEPIGLIRGDVNEPWWNPAVVYSWTRPVFGDLDGDRRDEAALHVVCANGGGTAAGQLRFSDVVFKAVGRTLRVIGIVTPQQPLDTSVGHVPLESVKRIERGHVVTIEMWYGPYDGTCCGSGIVRTTWSYRAGRLTPRRVRVIRPTWTSPVLAGDVIAEPGDHELFSTANGRPLRTRLVLAPVLRFDVWFQDLGRVTEHNVKVTLTILQPRARIRRTLTIARISPYSPNDTILHFRKLAGLRPGKATLVIRIGLRGATPVRYSIAFVRHR